MTRFPELFAALAAPFEPREVKARKQAGMQLQYITARVAMNRLDSVLGPENWWDDYTPAEDSVLCRLTIRLPDGQVLTKADAGGYAGMADSGDDDKSGYSDAFKRAAVKFGVARYLYGDGVPSFAQDGPAPADGRSTAPAAEKPASETWSQFISGRLRRLNHEWVREMVAEGIEPAVRQDHRELAKEPMVVNELCTRLIQMGKLEAGTIAKGGKSKNAEARDPTKARDAVKRFFGRSPNAIKRGVEKYLARKLGEARVELGMPDLDEDDTPGAPPPGKGDAYEGDCEGNGDACEEALTN